MQGRSQYSAAASLLGYIYQYRLAFLESLKRLKSDPDIAVAIEILDDVVFDKNSSPTEVIHYINRKASLTNASTDLWKTMTSLLGCIVAINCLRVVCGAVLVYE